MVESLCFWTGAAVWFTILAMVFLLAATAAIIFVWGFVAQCRLYRLAWKEFGRRFQAADFAGRRALVGRHMKQPSGPSPRFPRATALQMVRVAYLSVRAGNTIRIDPS